MNVRLPMYFLFLPALSACGVFAAHGQPLYSATFETSAGPEWSNRTISTTPKGARKFLGQFGNQTVTLTLPNMPAHRGVRVAFDLYLLRSWDGNSTNGGPDTWDFSVGGGPALLHTTFGTTPAVYNATPARTQGPSNPALAGASEVNTLGYTFGYNNAPLDAVYHLVFNIYHSAPSLSLQFTGSNLEAVDNESWGLDNVTVETADVPKPGPERANIVVNGDFESPYRTEANTLVTINAPSNAIPGWNITDGSVDINTLYWQNASGRQSLDMSGLDTAGTITQALPTTTGKSYLIDFGMAGNYGGPPVKQMQVRWGASLVAAPTYNTTNSTGQDMQWTRKRYVVTAPLESAAPTALTFVSLTPGSFGPALDDVRVTPEVPGEAGVNSEFELPEVGADGAVYQTFDTFGGWDVLDGDAQQVGPGWQAAGGKQFAFLNATTPGTISQEVPTAAGQPYLVRFAMAGDPRGGPVVKQMDAIWNGQSLGVQSFDTSGKTPGAMGWVYRAFLVPGAANSSPLQFQSLTTGAFGPALDAASAAPAVPGDADEDGVTTVADAVLALRQVTGADAPDPAIAALTDLVPVAGMDGRLHGDGLLTLSDAVAVLRTAGGLAG